MSTAILLVDVQNDFCPGGALAAPDGDAVIPVLNRLIEYAQEHGWQIIASRDWHPIESRHFAKHGGPWPPHCIQNTEGAEFHADLDLTDDVMIVTKGDDPEEDEGYSAFEGVNTNGISLSEYLEDLGVRTLFVGGLATDYCVKASVLDALSLGLKVNVIADGIRAVNLNPDDGNMAISEMENAGATISDLEEFETELT